jgi:hypothetical protein
MMKKRLDFSLVLRGEDRCENSQLAHPLGENRGPAWWLAFARNTRSASGRSQPRPGRDPPLNLLRFARVMG